MERNIDTDRELCAKASSGPWIVHGDGIHLILEDDNGTGINRWIGSAHFLDNKRNDVLFISAARDALPYYIDRAEKAEEELYRAREIIRKSHKVLEERIMELQQKNIELHLSLCNEHEQRESLEAKTNYYRMPFVK
jgi:hypothetical protein